MTTQLRLLIAVAAVALSIGVADESYAAFAGGSRLVYYYRETSFSSGPGLTILTLTNNHGSNPVTARFVVFNGSDCTAAGPFNTTLAAGETKQLSVADFAPPATFPAGVVDLWAVNGSNQPIRFDALTGTSIIADLGGSAAAATILPAVKMFSDDRTQTGVIADETASSTAAPLAIGAPLILPQSPGAVEDLIVLFSPATIPGQVPPPSTTTKTIPLTQFPAAGGAGTVTQLSTNCVYTNTITGALGAGIPAGHISAQPGGGKGILGWKFFRYSQGGISVLMGEIMQSWATFDLPASTQ